MPDSIWKKGLLFFYTLYNILINNVTIFLISMNYL